MPELSSDDEQSSRDVVSLHERMLCEDDQDFLLELIDEHADQLKSKDKNMRLPLHIECMNQCRLLVIQACIELYPESLSVADKDGNLPFHALLMNEDSGVIKEYINVVGFQRPLLNIIVVAVTMLIAYPDALKHPNNRGYLPVHVECNHQCRMEILEHCITRYPEALSVADKAGNLPLHSLLRNSNSTAEDDEDSEVYGNESDCDVALMLIEQYPLSLQHQNDSGELPLHIECENHCRYSIVTTCIEIYPEALTTPNKKGDLPLHKVLAKSIPTDDDEEDYCFPYSHTSRVLVPERLSSIEDVALMMIEQCPATLEHRNKVGYLPLHVECNTWGFQCRSAILSKCTKLYPGALSVADEEGYLPLHRLLNNALSSVKDALSMIEQYPTALQHRNKHDEFPLHVECRHQCRSSILSKCIQLYPDSSRIATGDGNLPLHIMLGNRSCTFDSFLALFKDYPEAMQHQNDKGMLPLHIGCIIQSSSSILAKCMEVYPQAIAVADKYQFFPLHRLLNNESSSEKDALSMIKQYPAAISHRNVYGNFPIHIECGNQCRPTILEKCIELHPEAIVSPNNAQKIPWEIALDRCRREGLHVMHKSLLVLLSAHPASFNYPSVNPAINKLLGENPRSSRILFNLLPSCLSSTDHIQSYHDLNWKPRSALLHLWLQLCTKEELRLSYLSKPRESKMPTNAKQRTMLAVLAKIVGVSALLSVHRPCGPGIGVHDDSHASRSYGMHRGEDLGDHWLRCIITYL